MNRLDLIIDLLKENDPQTFECTECGKERPINLHAGYLICNECAAWLTSAERRN